MNKPNNISGSQSNFPQDSVSTDSNAEANLEQEENEVLEQKSIKSSDDKTSDQKSEVETTSDILVKKLIEWEVKFVFGIIGDGINPIVEALRKHKQKIKFITVRHEEAAAFMACGYAKFTGKLGVCIATSGPGAIHLMNGLYDANKDHVPVLAITGSPSAYLLGTDYTQEINTLSLMQDVSVYNEVISGPKQARALIDLAIRAAMNSTGVSHLNFPKDTQEIETSQDKTGGSEKNLLGTNSLVERKEIPSEDDLKTAAALINGGQRVGILVGKGALRAGKEVEQLAELIGAPVTKALLGKAVIPDDSPYCTGGIGDLGTLPSKEWMKACDTLLILGSNMPYLEYYPKEANVIQVDHEPKRIGLRYPVDLGLIGDVKATVQALLPLLERKKDRSFLNQYQEAMDDWRKQLRQVEEGLSDLVRPQYLVAEVSKLLANDALVSIDTGAHTVFTARHWELKGGQQLAVSGNLASMAPGLPYAIAAQLAFPDRQCVAMVGDGGLSMLMAELVTAVRYSLPVKVIVFKNNSLLQDVYEQEAMGNEVFGGDLSPIDFVKVAEACGAEGYSCNKKETLVEVLAEAFASDRPAVIEVMTDPKQLPSPPSQLIENRL
jgi:pyruvate dehydrogenase (quinone)